MISGGREPKREGSTDEVFRLQAPATRSGLLRRALVAAGIAGVVGVGPRATAAPAPSPSRDVEILNFLLRLEYLQEDLYREALDGDALTGELRRYARVAGGHERAHVESLREALGADAEQRPTTQFGAAVERAGAFVAAAITLEETASAAYIGQAANLTDERIPTVAKIVSVEARHAAWIRDFAGRLPAPRAADLTKTPAQAMRTIERAGFVAG